MTRYCITKTKTVTGKLVYQSSRSLCGKCSVRISTEAPTIACFSWCLSVPPSKIRDSIAIRPNRFLSNPFQFIFRQPPDQVIRKWADKFCLHCNIFICIRHIWIKPVLCSRIVSLCHYTSLWTHRCLQFSPSAHRNGRVFRRSVQTACRYWILNSGKSSSNWNSQTNASRLWWSVCWCEYSKTMGKGVQRWRIGANRFEWENTKNKACDGFKKIV